MTVEYDISGEYLVSMATQLQNTNFKTIFQLTSFLWALKHIFRGNEE